MMSWFVTEPNSLPSTPAFCVIFSSRPSSFAPRSCACASAADCAFSSSARRAELEKAQAELLAKAQERGTKLDGLTLQITQKAGVDGRLFGSVTNYDVVEALKAQGFEVERSQVRMPAGPLKQVGEYPISIALHTDVVVTVNISVLGDRKSVV